MVGRFESTPFAGETAAAANGVESTAGVARTDLMSKCLDTRCAIASVRRRVNGGSRVH